MAKLLLEKLQNSSVHKFCKYCSMIRLDCFLVLFLLFFSACGGTAATINKDKSDLMPKSVAMAIFEQYGFKQWAEKPFMTNVSLGGVTEKEYIEFNQIEKAIYAPKRNTLEFSCSSAFRPFFLVTFPNITVYEALELTHAARALGATKIDELKKGF